MTSSGHFGDWCSHATAAMCAVSLVLIRQNSTSLKRKVEAEV